MMQVGIYLFEGTFSGTSEYEYVSPEAGDRLPCVLFLAQQGKSADWQAAQVEIARYGFIDVAPNRHEMPSADQSASRSFQGFKSFYDEALEMGSSLLYYQGGDGSPGF